MNPFFLFIVETLKRFGSKNPKYFTRLQIAAGVLVAASLAVIYVLPNFKEVPATWIASAWHVIEVSVAAGLVAQLPKPDTTQK